MAGQVESLNVSVAAGVLLYEAFRQKIGLPVKMKRLLFAASGLIAIRSKTMPISTPKAWLSIAVIVTIKMRPEHAVPVLNTCQSQQTFGKSCWILNTIKSRQRLMPRLAKGYSDAELNAVADYSG